MPLADELTDLEREWMVLTDYQKCMLVDLFMGVPVLLSRDMPSIDIRLEFVHPGDLRPVKHSNVRLQQDALIERGYVKHGSYASFVTLELTLEGWLLLENVSGEALQRVVERTRPRVKK